MKDYKDIPFINLSKDNLKLVTILSDAEAGKILKSLFPFIYDGVEPDFEDHITKGIWTNLVDTIDRKAEKYIKKVNQGTENLQKVNAQRKAKKAVVDTDTGEIIKTFDEEYSNDTGITYNKETDPQRIIS